MVAADMVLTDMVWELGKFYYTRSTCCLVFLTFDNFRIIVLTILRTNTQLSWGDYWTWIIYDT